MLNNKDRGKEGEKLRIYVKFPIDNKKEKQTTTKKKKKAA